MIENQSRSKLLRSRERPYGVTLLALRRGCQLCGSAVAPPTVAGRPPGAGGGLRSERPVYIGIWLSPKPPRKVVMATSVVRACRPTIGTISEPNDRIRRPRTGAADPLLSFGAALLMCKRLAAAP